MKPGPAMIVTFGAFVLASCQHNLTLEEAQALCTKQGGLLVVIYTQTVTASGIGPQVASPGDCVSPDKFGVTPPASIDAPAPAH